MLTYDANTGNLKAAAERVTDEISKALAELQDEVIKNPQNIGKAKMKYEAKVKKISEQWIKDYTSWTNNDLAKSYVTGIKEADVQIAAVEAQRAKPGLQLSLHQELFEEVAENGIADLLQTQPSVLTSVPNLSKYAKKQFENFMPHVSSYDIYRKAMYENLEGITGQIVRGAQDVYKETARMIMDTGLHEGSQVTMRKLGRQISEKLAQGKKLTITYANGAKVPLDSYSEMVARTMSQKAANEAKLNRFAEKGYDLVRLSSHFRACERCAMYQGKVYSRSGQSKQYPPLSRAIQGGMFHPNCLHTVSPYFPGLSSDELQMSASDYEQKMIDKYGFKKANQMAYKAQQKQRYFERKIRQAKRKEALSVNPIDGAKEHEKILAYRAALRDHLKANPYLPRDYFREGVPGWRYITGLARDEAAEITRALAKQAMEQAALAEPEISAIINKVEKLNPDARKFGYKFRLKGEGSTMRKITNDFRDKAGYITMETITDELGDMVRYTYIVDDIDDYARLTQNIAVDLKNEGMECYKWKNYWEGEGYKGINSNWTYKGQRIEIQFHTPESFKVKEGIDTFTGEVLENHELSSHYWYEIQRVSSDQEVIAMCTDKINDLWRPVAVPPGVEDISIEATEKMDKILGYIDPSATRPEMRKFKFELTDTGRQEMRRAIEEHDALLELWVDDLMKRPLPFNTHAEAEDWLRSMGYENFNRLDEMDLRAFVDIKPAMEKMYDEFPEIKYVNKNFEVGVLTARHRAEWEDGIYINDMVVKNYDKYIRDTMNSGAEAYIYNMYEMTLHENTHAIQKVMQFEKDGANVLEEFNDFVAKRIDHYMSMDEYYIRQKITRYGMTNPAELQAEALAQFFSSHPTSELTQEIADEYRRIWNNKDEWLDYDKMMNAYATKVDDYVPPVMNIEKGPLKMVDFEDYGEYSDEYFAASNAYFKQAEEYKTKVKEWASDLANNRPLPFETHDEAREWFKSLGIEAKNIEDIDLRAFVDIKPAYERFYDEFPMIAKTNKVFSTSDFGIGAMAKFEDGGVVFNSRMLKDYEFALNTMGDGHSVASTAYDVVNHELGHGLDDLFDFEKGLWKNGEVNRYFDFETSRGHEMRAFLTNTEIDTGFDTIQKAISEYSTSNIGELTAESFAQYFSGIETSEVASKIVQKYKDELKTLDEWFDEEASDLVKGLTQLENPVVEVDISKIPTLKYFDETQENFINQRRGFYAYLDNPKYAESAKKTIEEFETTMKTILDNSDVAMRVPGEDVLASILEEGRFKNQLETGTSMGMIDNKRRESISHNLFGAETYQMDKKDYEVYGYMAKKDVISDLFDEEQMSTYGDILIKFKPEVRQRTTFTIGDSIDEGGESRKLMAAKVNDPKACSITKVSMDEVEGLDLTDIHNCSDFADIANVPYVEAQIHGDLLIDDISEISIIAESREDFIESAMYPERAAYAMELLDSTDIKINFYTINDLPH